jgi:hypothetical protein
MRYERATYRLIDGGRFGKLAAIAAAAGLALSLLGYFINSQQFFHSYLISYVFWLTIALGGLFFTMLHHLVAAKWSVVLRRLSENIMSTIIIFAIFFIPLLFGMHDLFHWSHAEAAAQDYLLQAKTPYFNIPFFIGRAAIYFLIWLVLARILDRLSISQDSGHSDRLIRKMGLTSAPGMILFALTVTFAAFDWLMSLDAHWYSTIFGVYIFSGSLVGLLAFLTLIVIFLKKNDVLNETISIEHLFDLGKLIFAFIIFWGYMSFSQYLLIWYGNIPEETVWFLHRWENSWSVMALILVFGHFAIPFFILFPRSTKRNTLVLTIITPWILLMHWADIYWIIMPSLHQHGIRLSWIDLTTTVGLGGVFLWYLWRKMTARALVPINDPGLQSSIHFVDN